MGTSCLEELDSNTRGSTADKASFDGMDLGWLMPFVHSALALVALAF